MLLCMAACSCTDQSQRLPIGEDHSWIPEKEGVRLCEEFLRKQGYTNAQLIAETAMRGKYWYEFSTNGRTAPLQVMVDRKTRKVSYGDWRDQE